MASNVSYADSNDCGKRFENILTDIIVNNSLKSVCDIGGGANPVFDLEFHEKNELIYTLLDISQVELDKAPTHYNKVFADITNASRLPDNEWDLVFSQALAEHVSDGRRFHENIFRILKPGGYAIHLFPTLYALPFLANKIIPESLSSKLLDMLLPRDRFQHDKFPAHYSWCKGPTKPMIRNIEEIGYEVIDYIGLFGHRYYRFFPPLQMLQNTYTKILLKYASPYQTSYAIQVLRKP